MAQNHESKETCTQAPSRFRSNKKLQEDCLIFSMRSMSPCPAFRKFRTSRYKAVDWVNIQLVREIHHDILDSFAIFSRQINRPASQRLLPFMLPAHASVQRWRILKCIPTTCFLTNVSWDRSANTLCKFNSFTLSLCLKGVYAEYSTPILMNECRVNESNITECDNRVFL